MQVGINLFGATGMVAVGALAAWYRVKGRAKAPRSVAAPSVAHLRVDAQPDTG
jgi:hypothetical protein